MPQTFIPIFAPGLIHINPDLAYQKENGSIYYFNGQSMPIFSHDEMDVKSFKMIVSQFCVNGYATQAEIIRAFGIPPISMKRAVKTFREKGAAGFFSDSRHKRKPRVLTPEVLSAIQQRLDAGLPVGEIANELHLKVDTIRQAIRSGRLKKTP